MFAKLVNGYPEILKLPVRIGGQLIYTNEPAVLRSAGYKIYNPTQPPKAESGQTVNVQYVETDTEIIQKWHVSGNATPLPENVLTTDEVNEAIQDGVNSVATE